MRGGNSVAAVKNADVAVQEGQVVAVVGQSGSGKSTLAGAVLRILDNRVARVSGQIIWKGQNLLELNELALNKVRGSEISMVFQNPSQALHPMMTIGRQMNLIHQKLASNGLNQKTLSVKDALELAKLQDVSRVLRQYPHELSGGMKQRIVIGIALMGRPNLIVADEPTSALDVTVQLEIMSLFRETVHQLSTSMLLISHHLGVVAGLADQVVVMRSGSIIERGSVDSVYLNPEESYTKQLMGVGAANGSA